MQRFMTRVKCDNKNKGRNQVLHKSAYNEKITKESFKYKYSDAWKNLKLKEKGDCWRIFFN